MERYARDITKGSYTPSFFTIRIPSNEYYENLLKNERMSEQAEAFFLHEYIHFLQDLTTIPGLSNICIVVDYMKWVTHQGKDGKLRVPSDPKPEDGYNLWNNQTLSNERIGHGALKDVVVKEITGFELNNQDIEVNGIFHSQLNSKVSFKDSNNHERFYVIGEYAISESMAYTIEQMIYPNVLPDAYDCPYNIIKIVCNKYLPEFADDPCKIVALCDACLMFSFPGRIFKMAIELLKSINYKSLSAEKVFDIVSQNEDILKTEHTIVKGITVSDHLEKYSIMAAEQLSGYFTTDNYEKERLFSVLMLYVALEIRKQHPYFMLDIARGGVLRENNHLRVILGELGCPVVLNNTNGLTTIIGRISFYLNNDPSCFWVFNQMYKIFKHGCLHDNTYKCEMIDWCKESFKQKNVKDLTTNGDDCLYSPWKRMSDEEFQLCTFGRFWRTIKLSGIEPVSLMEGNSSVN